MATRRSRKEPAWDRNRFEVTPLRSVVEVRDLRRLGSPAVPAPRFSVFASDEEAIAHAIEKYLTEVDSLPPAVKQQDHKRYQHWLRDTPTVQRRNAPKAGVRRRKVLVRMEVELDSLDGAPGAQHAAEDVRGVVQRLLADRFAASGAVVTVRALRG
jgi:hypothetical protein